MNKIICVIHSDIITDIHDQHLSQEIIIKTQHGLVTGQSVSGGAGGGNHDDQFVGWRGELAWLLLVS